MPLTVRLPAGGYAGDACCVRGPFELANQRMEQTLGRPVGSVAQPARK
jgi:hypothetical protein